MWNCFWQINTRILVRPLDVSLVDVTLNVTKYQKAILNFLIFRYFFSNCNIVSYKSIKNPTWHFLRLTVTLSNETFNKNKSINLADPVFSFTWLDESLEFGSFSNHRLRVGQSAWMNESDTNSIRWIQWWNKYLVY